MTSRRPQPLRLQDAPRIRRRRRLRVAGSIAPRRAYVALAAWWALLIAMQSVIPEPADPEAFDAVEQLLATVFTLGIVATTLLLASLARVGAWVAAGTGGALTLLAIACPVTGHHELAAWWVTYTGAAAGMTAVGLWAARGPAFDGA